MGIFDWALKTERVKHETVAEQEQNTSGVDGIETVCETPVQADARAEASAVLFNFGAASQPTSYGSPVTYPQQSSFGAGAYSGGQTPFVGAFAGGTLGNRHILVVTPRSDSEVIAIVEHIKTNEAVIINFEGVPVAETQRRIDFLSGVACGLGGTIRPLDSHKYIMTPSGIGVR